MWQCGLMKLAKRRYRNILAKNLTIYIQPQLFALLILKQFFQEDYRGLVEVIDDFSDIKKILNLEIVPHYTTLQKASKRLLSSKRVQKLLKTTIKVAQHIEILKKKSAISAYLTFTILILL